VSDYDHFHRIAIENDPCVYCGAEADTMDHVHPRSRGGTRGWHNAVAACEKCNLAKADSSPLGFLLGHDTPERWFKRLAGLTKYGRATKLPEGRGGA
jgi:5-methylcytosine-specific restriction endonuclease McrA